MICVYPGRSRRGGEAKAIASSRRSAAGTRSFSSRPRYNRSAPSASSQRCGDSGVVEYGIDEPWWRNAIGVPLEWIKLAVSETVRRGC